MLPGLSRANVLQLVTCPLFFTSVISLCSNSHYQLSSEPWVLDFHSLNVPNLKFQESYLILFWQCPRLDVVPESNRPDLRLTNPDRPQGRLCLS